MAKSSFATGFAGFLIGIVTGLAIAAGAALFIVNSPIPFVDNKVDKVTADVDPAQKLQGAVVVGTDKGGSGPVLYGLADLFFLSAGENGKIIL